MIPNAIPSSSQSSFVLDLAANENSTNSNELIAKQLAQSGKPVFPCKHDKSPYTRNGYKDASASLPQIELWWRCFPDAIPGLVTGRASGVFVIDIDVANGKLGKESLASLENQYGKLPDTFDVETPSGGRHIYFSLPSEKEIRCSTSALAPHIDVRGEGGYVIAPGATLKDGRSYRIAHAVTCADAPAWLLDRAAAPNRRAASMSGAPINAGTRNSKLTSLAGSMRRRGLEASIIERALQQLNQELCDPPLDASEVQRIADSIGKYGYPYSLSHTGNSERFRDTFKNDLRYSSAGHWKFWDGTRWISDACQRANEMGKEIARCLETECAALADPNPQAAAEDVAQKNEEKKGLKRWAKQTLNQPLKMVTLAQSDPALAISEAAFDDAPYLFNMRNGTLDLKQGYLLPHNREHLLTKIAPVRFSPDAPCPTWLSFLGQIFNDDAELIGFVQRLYGMALTGDTREQIMAVLYGTGKNGKSVLVQTLQYIFGEYFKATRPETLMLKISQCGASPEIMGMKGARAIFASESAENRKMDAALIKQLTGGDLITGRGLYENESSFQMTALISLVTNYMPKINGGDYALMRRIKVLPFLVTIPEHQRDEKLPEKLKLEAEGIMAWLVRGAADWQQNGLRTPAIVQIQTEQYGYQNDTVSQFIEARCLTGDRLRVPSSALYSAYGIYCEITKEQPTSQMNFSQAMEKRFTKKRDAAGVFFVGVGLRGVS